MTHNITPPSIGNTMCACHPGMRLADLWFKPWEQSLIRRELYLSILFTRRVSRITFIMYDRSQNILKLRSLKVSGNKTTKEWRQIQQLHIGQSRKCLICIRSRKTSRISLGIDTNVICRWWSAMMHHVQGTKWYHVSKNHLIYYTDISCLGGVFAKNTSRETKNFPRRKAREI